MAKEKNEQIKIYVVMGLAVVLLIMAYFRFVREKENPDEAPAIATASFVDLDIPEIRPISPQEARSLEPVGYEYPQTIIRDIFSSLTVPRKLENRHEEQHEAQHEEQYEEQSESDLIQTLKLTGTIVGGSKPVAIIDGQFIHDGDWIGDYRVARIGNKDVLLVSNNKRITLEMIKNE